MGEKQTPLKDLIKGALEHYNEISKEAYHWSSIVPEAIKFYGEYKEVIERVEALPEKWRRVEILANAEQVAIKMAHHKCADELDDALK